MGVACDVRGVRYDFLGFGIGAIVAGQRGNRIVIFRFRGGLYFVGNFHLYRVPIDHVYDWDFRRVISTVRSRG